MAWNDMTAEQMEAQLLRQAQTIGKMREALTLADAFIKAEHEFSNSLPRMKSMTSAALKKAAERGENYKHTKKAAIAAIKSALTPDMRT